MGDGPGDGMDRRDNAEGGSKTTPKTNLKTTLGRVAAMASAVVVTGLIATLLVAMGSAHPSTASGQPAPSASASASAQWMRPRTALAPADLAATPTPAPTALPFPTATATLPGGVVQPTATLAPAQPTPTPVPPVPVTFPCGSGGSTHQPLAPDDYSLTLCVAAPVADAWFPVHRTYCQGQAAQTTDSVNVHVVGGQPTSVQWTFRATGCTLPFTVAYDANDAALGGSSGDASYSGAGSFIVTG